MSDIVIKAEGVSKKYIIAHQQKEKYTALRDVITNKAKSLFNKKSKQDASGSLEEFWALKDVSFDIKQGDRVGIIGRNGAGKSTLLKVLSRITEPSSGRITLKGRVASLLEVGTGFHPELTGRENIFLNGTILGMSRNEIRKKFDEIVAFAEIEKFLDTPVKRYSSGMYVRLAFSVAAHLEPEILIVDEVLAVGDAQFQKKCLGKMEDVSKNGERTVLFVSHNMGVVAQLCNKCLFLENGSVVKSGTTKEVIDLYVNNDHTSKAIYRIKKTALKNNYFEEVCLADINGNAKTDFLFDESIVLNFKFIINNYSSDLQIGIGLNDKYQNRIFTILQSIDYFNFKENRYSGSVELPSNLIAPNSYCLVLAIWTKGGEIFDLLNEVLFIKIHDTGTALSLYEGGDNGYIVINPKWINEKNY